MNELRAPDPTLTSTICLEVVVRYSEPGATPSAHRITDHIEDEAKTVCGLVSPSTRPTQEAQWFAVPCRECFPDAPPPGHEFRIGAQETKPRLPARPDDYLSWQVSS